MPKDKRTKAYKEWVKKYGSQTSESNVIPEMPKDKRTKAYKEWVKQYGDKKLPEKSQGTSSKSDKKENEPQPHGTKNRFEKKLTNVENESLKKSLIELTKVFKTR
jgi:thiaminase